MPEQYWKIPPEIYAPLAAEFGFDPCPCPRPAGAVLPALRRHIAMMSPHRRDREGGRLLLAAEAEITRLQVASEAAPIQHAPELFAALVALVEAENASIDQFTAKEIAGIEAAMKRAREALALAAPTGSSKTLRTSGAANARSPKSPARSCAPGTNLQYHDNTP